MREKDISESELSRRSGLAQPTINRILNKTVGSYRVDTVKALAKGLRIDASTLISAAMDDESKILTNRRFEAYAEAFDAYDITEKEWQVIEEKFFARDVEAFKALRTAANEAVDTFTKEQRQKPLTPANNIFNENPETKTKRKL